MSKNSARAAMISGQAMFNPFSPACQRLCQNIEKARGCSAGCHGKILEQPSVQQQQLCHRKLQPSKQQQQLIKQLRVYGMMRYTANRSCKLVLIFCSYISRLEGLAHWNLAGTRSSDSCMLPYSLAKIIWLCSTRLLCNRGWSASNSSSYLAALVVQHVSSLRSCRLCTRAREFVCQASDKSYLACCILPLNIPCCWTPPSQHLQGRHDHETKLYQAVKCHRSPGTFIACINPSKEQKQACERRLKQEWKIVPIPAKGIGAELRRPSSTSALTWACIADMQS